MFIRFLLLFFAFSFTACQQSGEQTQAIAVHQVATASIASSTAIGDFSALPPATDLVFQSLDGGITWQDITKGLPRDLFATTLYARDGEVFLGSMNGIFSTRTARPMAPVWEKEHLLDVLQHEFIATIMPANGGAIARSHPSGFFQNLPGTGIWKPIYKGMAGKEVNDVLNTVKGPVLISTNFGIFRDAYQADMWGQVFAQGQVLSLIETKGVILGAGEIGVVRSTDGGDHWTWVLTEEGRSRKTILIGDDIYAISMGGGTREEHRTDPLRTASKLSRSSDKGLTWERLDTHHILGPRIYDVLQVEGALFCSSSKGLFKSPDKGKTWNLIRPTTSERAIPMIAADGPVLYTVDVFDGC